jgi:hypothetical protein
MLNTILSGTLVILLVVSAVLFILCGIKAFTEIPK